MMIRFIRHALLLRMCLPCFLLLAVFSCLFGLSAVFALEPKKPAFRDLNPKLPDLAVDKMEVFEVPAGQMTVDGQAYAETRHYVAFTISNRGTDIAPPTRVEIICGSLVPTDVCPQFPKTDIPQLWPRPGEISGSYVLWNSPAIYLRNSQSMYFKITVDPENLIKEINKDNNSRTYGLSEVRLRQNLHAETAKKVLQSRGTNLGTGAPTASRAPEAKKTAMAQPSGPQTGQAVRSTLIIEGLSASPPKPTAGVPFELSARGLIEGPDPIPPGRTLHLACRVISGGPSCPAPTGPLTLKTPVAAGGIQNIGLGTFSAQPGVYEISLGTGPEAGRHLKTLTLTVEAPHVSRKPPAVGTPQTTPLTGQTPAGPAQTPALSPTPNRPLKR